MARIIGLDFESIADGDGVRVVIFFSGCKHNCKGCHNPSSHDFNVGKPFDDEVQAEIIEYVRSTPFISGVTLSGGDPMYSAKDIVPFLKKLRAEVPQANVWVYTGYTYEEVIKDTEMNELLKLCDVLVDGLFILEQRDLTISYRGSRNQRLVDINKSYEKKGVVLWEPPE